MGLLVPFVVGMQEIDSVDNRSRGNSHLCRNSVHVAQISSSPIGSCEYSTDNDMLLFNVYLN
jgi:hypothetical protein